VTIGAQLAVAPLLILHFGSVPLLSPLVNLAAAPLVTMSTVGGALGVAVLPPLIGPAAWLAGLVMRLARGAAAWPQLGALGLACLVGGAAAFVLLRALRPLLAVCCAVALVLALVLPRSSLPVAGVAVLDVGQGDAILIHGGGGRFALVDGGPDHGLLMGRLQRYAVDSIELVVLTHVHADHASGLIGLTRRVPIGEVWVANEPHQTPASEAFLEEVRSAGVAIRTPAPGYHRSLGDLRIGVEGPIRRYASPNDQSIVLMVSGPARSILLSGDIETFAQSDLDHLRASVLKVPHQGAATSDPDWLSDVSADVAVISVGPNEYGHPAQWVIDVLEESGATVHRTDLEGDVRIDLSDD
jgi:competence protein ComEC